MSYDPAEAETVAASLKMLDSMDLQSTGVITIDEWLKFCREHIAAKTVRKLLPTKVNELYMLEIFTDHDTDKDGIIKLAEFNNLIRKFLAVPLMFELPAML